MSSQRILPGPEAPTGKMTPETTHIHVLDDDPVYTRILVYQLRQHGFECSSSQHSEELMARLQDAPIPDVFILDYHLGPKQASGLDLCRKVRAYVNKPVIMLSANDSVETKVSCLNAGADQYIVKPCDITELLARIGVVLRNQRPAEKPDSTGILELSDSLSLDWESSLMTGIHDQTVHLTDKEAAMLEVLIHHQHTAVNRYDAFQSIYGFAMTPDNRSIDILVSRLRRKLASVHDRATIRTIRGQGYRLSL